MLQLTFTAQRAALPGGVWGNAPCCVHAACAAACLTCCAALRRCSRPQECLRDARRVEAITGQQEDRDHYVVPVR